MKRGFTIVELLMVIGILSVLIGISVSAVSGAIKTAREQRADALCKLVGQGIATYYEQKEEWPVNVLNGDSITLNGDVNGKKNTSGEKVTYVLENDQVDDAVRTVAEMTKKDNPMMDVSGLFVAKKGSEKYGMDFMTAIHGSRNNSRKLKLSDMVFGYPDAKTGRFRRFKMVYYPATDTIKVSTQD